MATYVNDLRLKEISTGDESGTWGTSTNTNLELIGEALGYATQEVFGSDADATTTIADGASDPARAMYFKITSAGSLTATRTCTIAPNTVSRVMFIENATSGSQSIAISQGSGASVTILTGKTAVVYLDGAGATAAVVDAMSGVDPGVTDTLAEVLAAGNTSGGTNIELSTTDKVQFRDAAIYLNSSVDGQLDIVADTEIQIAATTVDLNGNLDVSGTTVSAGKITADAGIDIDNINIDGTTIALSSGDLTLDVAGDIILDADTGVWRFKDAGTTLYQIAVDGASVVLYTGVSDADMVFKGNDGGSTVTALTLDMSEAGAATFNSTLATTELNVSQSANSTRSYKLLQGYGYTTGGNYYGQYAIGTTYNSAANTGTLEFFTGSGSSAPTNRLTIYSSGDTVFNESGVDADFRIESDTDANALFVEGSSGNVGIGTASPITFGANTHGLTLNGTAAGQHISFQQSGSYKGSLFQSDNTILLGSELGEVKISSATGVVINENGIDADFRVESDANTHMLFVDGGNNKIGINESHPAASLDIRQSTDGNTDGLLVRPQNESQSMIYSFLGMRSTYFTHFVTDSANSGNFEYFKFFAGTEDINGELLQLHDDGATFNEGGLDRDFRVESDTNANMLFVDGGANHVNIGTATDLGGTLNVLGNTAISGTTGGAYVATGATLSIQGTGSFNSDYFGSSLATVAIRSNEPDNNGWNPTLHITTIRQSLVTNKDSNGGIGFSTIDDSNVTGIDDAARITIFNENSSSNTSPTAIRFYNNVGGSKTQVAQAALDLFSTGAVFNNDSNDMDFRVESDTESNAFTVDGETGQVGVGSRSGFRFGNGSLQGNAGSSGGGYPTIGYNIKFTGTQEDYGTLITDTSWRLDIGENNRLQVFSRSSTAPVASGAVYTAGPYVSINGTDWTSSSDARLKENVNTITGAIDKVKAMRPVNYTWIHDGEGASNQVGFIAQEMALVVPEVVDIPEDDEVHQGIQYGKLVPVLTAALQEALTKIETLESRIAALES
jgi:hypothetical protein